MKVLLLGLVTFILLSAGIPEDIYDKTWHIRDGDMGAHFVIYKDNEGAVKAIWQHEGLQVFITETIIYEVSISGNMLYFNNGHRVLGEDDKPIKNIAFTYSEKKVGFVSRKRAQPYKVIAQRPIIYSQYGWLIGLEDLKDNSYEESDFQ